MNQETDDIIMLQDEEGNDVSFILLDMIEYREREFIVTVPDVDPPEDTVLIMEALPAEDPEESLLVPVEDELLLEAVFRVFKRRMEAGE